ncbi:16S rRNA (guanine(966)-N(2))-methyltransferase RsmD [Pedobacter cryoconitis]|jgi:16S rRNA (guanine966-N2)-methyltransferase|uniref:16S rRNA (Guanine(966)-N(2))-methyltransferase RsmD n=2 Tax=Pedobacter cryoconitis TaxID=188932 RepID=A0A7W9DK93_9SPHI|nr:RsmD family RNA methyltransferase [Pedobacter cryoconitis]MBB5621579.1 16S rRNA (guanine(966)-N(2))-methyltransferase RsmD [Pedobacter cryoconitis]MBB5643915.1 16S rRNA (guanine(966)-N(2))-methyltransferase RsmD [Pedobacter cryoconitis]
MRIIGGKLKGIRMNAPASLPVRPTTDMAKEALFNILYNTYDFDSCSVLDLFSGTGNISIEFASRGIKEVTAVDKHSGCIFWLKSVIEKYELNEITLQKADVFKFLEQHTKSYQIIFADPPYDLTNIPLIPQLVAKNKLLTENGLLVVEHPSLLKLKDQPGYKETRRYGNSSFSFFNYTP